MKKNLKQQLTNIISEKLWKIADDENRTELMNDIAKLLKNYSFTDETTNGMLSDGTIFFQGIDLITKKVIQITIYNNLVKIKEF